MLKQITILKQFFLQLIFISGVNQLHLQIQLNAQVFIQILSKYQLYNVDYLFHQLAVPSITSFRIIHNHI